MKVATGANGKTLSGSTMAAVPDSLKLLAAAVGMTTNGAAMADALLARATTTNTANAALASVVLPNCIAGSRITVAILAATGARARVMSGFAMVAAQSFTIVTTITEAIGAIAITPSPVPVPTATIKPAPGIIVTAHR